MINKSALQRSIIKLVTLLLLTQILLFTFIIRTYSITETANTVFYVFTLLYHTAFMMILISSRKYFRIEPSFKALSRINFSNMLTSFRISSLPTLCFLLILNSRGYKISLVLFFLMSITFITDFFDGMISRKTGTITTIGKFMDSTSDYILLFIISLAFLVFHIIPKWIFIFLFLRLGLHSLGILILYTKQGFIKFETTYTGKFSVFVTMSLFGLEILESIFETGHFLNTVVFYSEIFCAFVLVISTIEKLFLTTRKILAKKDKKAVYTS